MPAPLDALGIGEAALVGTSGESIPGAARVTLTWGRHLPTLEAPATMNPLILNWLRDVAGVTAANLRAFAPDAQPDQPPPPGSTGRITDASHRKWSPRLPPENPCQWPTGSDKS